MTLATTALTGGRTGGALPVTGATCGEVFARGIIVTPSVTGAIFAMTNAICEAIGEICGAIGMTSGETAEIATWPGAACAAISTASKDCSIMTETQPAPP